MADKRIDAYCVRGFFVKRGESVAPGEIVSLQVRDFNALAHAGKVIAAEDAPKPEPAPKKRGRPKKSEGE